MQRLSKRLLVLAVPTLILGGIVSFSGIQFAPEWTFALPLGVILLGLSVICWMMEREVAKFDEEQRSKIESETANRRRIIDVGSDDKRKEHSIGAVKAGVTRSS